MLLWRRNSRILHAYPSCTNVVPSRSSSLSESTPPLLRHEIEFGQQQDGARPTTSAPASQLHCRGSSHYHKFLPESVQSLFTTANGICSTHCWRRHVFLWRIFSHRLRCVASEFTVLPTKSFVRRSLFCLNEPIASRI